MFGTPSCMSHHLQQVLALWISVDRPTVVNLAHPLPLPQSTIQPCNCIERL